MSPAAAPYGREHAVRAAPARVHDPLGDALVVEVGDLLAEVEVLDQRRSALAGLERVVGVGQPGPERGRQRVALLGPPDVAAVVATAEAPAGPFAAGAAWSGLRCAGHAGSFVGWPSDTDAPSRPARTRPSMSCRP